MHELSLMADLMRKLDAIAREHYPAKVIDVTIRLGALAHISAQHLREHFVRACQGTALEGARLQIETRHRHVRPACPRHPARSCGGGGLTDVGSDSISGPRE